MLSQATTCKCSIFEMNHDTEEWVTFLAQSIEDRSKILYKRKLCYKCLSEISKEHNAKSCSKGRSCKVCNGSHPTVLHGVKLKKKGNHGNNDSKERGVEIAYPSINTGSDIISMWIVLVQIRQRESGKVLQTYALLDNCSQGKFILDPLTKDLYIPEKKHPLPSKKKKKRKWRIYKQFLGNRRRSASCKH